MIGVTATQPLGFVVCCVLGLVMGMLTSVTLRAMLPALGRLGYNIQENRKG